MDNDDRYRLWKQRRARADRPEGFADAVMASVRDHERARRQRRGLRHWLVVLLSSRASRLGIGALAGLTCLYRMVQVIGIFLLP
jgi:hypothetical protein